MPPPFSSSRSCALLALACAGAYVGCGSDQSTSADAQVPGSGGAAAHGGVTARAGGAPNGGSGGTSSSQAGTSVGGSANAGNAGQSASAGSNAQAGGAGRAGSGGAGGAGGTGGRGGATGAAGGSHAGAAGTAGSPGSGGSSGTQPNITVWIAGQALINVGVVLRVLPVLGVPLPFMSQGGTSLLSVLLASGVLLAFARSLPAKRTAMPARARARVQARTGPRAR